MWASLSERTIGVCINSTDLEAKRGQVKTDSLAQANFHIAKKDYERFKSFKPKALPQ